MMKALGRRQPHLGLEIPLETEPLRPLYPHPKNGAGASPLLRLTTNESRLVVKNCEPCLHWSPQDQEALRLKRSAAGLTGWRHTVTA